MFSRLSRSVLKLCVSESLCVCRGSEYHVSSPCSGLAVGVCVCGGINPQGPVCVCVCLCRISVREPERTAWGSGGGGNAAGDSVRAHFSKTHTHANYDKTRRTSPKGEKKHNEISLASQFILQDRANWDLTFLPTKDVTCLQ